MFAKETTKSEIQSSSSLEKLSLQASELKLVSTIEQFFPEMSQVSFLELQQSIFQKQLSVPFGNKNASSDFCQLLSCDGKRIVSKVEERKDECQQRLDCFDHRMNTQCL